ncbi:hypothetical protein E2562_023814 [Oryza meyeriana var. granulata]|uniref:DUF834 domain-containing protein n=1 Tax=Oryza meyeriana var. granulata TaxID=110450 RepID=A0A6G1D5S2_9ORYZ|nr:hypothetical protein E2562_023814 [Oryza meyeriana var. granulata]
MGVRGTGGIEERQAAVVDGRRSRGQIDWRNGGSGVGVVGLWRQRQPVWGRGAQLEGEAVADGGE